MSTSVRGTTATRQASQANERLRWLLACTSRLSELRPADDKRLIASVAADMWNDVGSFDPFLAAEMEHESWPGPDFA